MGGDAPCPGAATVQAPGDASDSVATSLFDGSLSTAQT
ncbi:hypothetical protein XaFJ1_GM002051 [Xanthomonas albilineans]|nr:hypothetical protein XaFJ1_GM002051 [Xanthomonas albilineans]